MLEHKIGSTVWNKEFRLKYKHARRDEMKKVLKDERQKARKEDGRNKVFNERLGVHIFSDQEGRVFIVHSRIGRAAHWSNVNIGGTTLERIIWSLIDIHETLMMRVQHLDIDCST